MYVIGTAGHVDHGKSTLVRALTGIDPDRLREEKEREMTIDLGFAWMNLANGEQVGIVDVPGHRDFIENMLAGVGGIDAVLFVVAADEGVMPQTREHLAILDLLGVPGGIIVLTKTDLIDDPEWLALVEMDMREIVAGTVLADAPVVPVSARSGAGLDELKAALTTCLSARPPRADRGHPRLPIDRVFTMSGFGTVVTGTLSGGSLAVGDPVELQPGGLAGRIRGLQAYKVKLDRVGPGSRVAVNLTGIDKSDVKRGQVLTTPGWLRATALADVHFRHLRDASRPLKHNAEVKFFSGAAEARAYVRLLDAEELPPGAVGWLQIVLLEPLALTRGDRFILRYPSPGETIGGGVVVDPAPGRRWRRRRPDVIARLETLARGTPSELVAQLLESAGMPLKLAEIKTRSGMPAAEVETALSQAAGERLVHNLGGGWWLAASVLLTLLKRIRDELAAYHRAEPLRRGMPREQLRSRLGLERAAFDRLLSRAEDIAGADADLVWAKDYTVHLDVAQQAAVDRLLAAFARAPYAPPSFRESVDLIGEDLVRFLLERGDLVMVQPDVLLSAEAYAEMFRAIADALDTQGSISAAELRDRFNTTRKYAIGLLEYLDAKGITRREGDVRVWGRRPER